MRRLVVAAFLAAPSLAFFSRAERAEVGVMVRIDRGTQSMAVSVDGISRYAWRVSTGRAGFGTPSGVFIRSPWPRTGSRTNTTMRRCRMRSCSMAVSRSMAATTLRSSAGRRLTAACACRALPRCCSASSAAKACTTPRSWCNRPNLPSQRGGSLSRVHRSSWPDLFRPSTSFSRTFKMPATSAGITPA